MREQVKLAVRHELQDWFVAVRMASRTIGAKAMERFQRAQVQAAEARSLEVGHSVDPISIPPEDVDFDAEEERTFWGGERGVRRTGPGVGGRG